MARPRFHALATVPFAWGAYRRWGAGAAFGLAAASIFVDLDHLADYFWVRWRGQRRHFFAPLHAWELVAAVGALALSLRRRRTGHSLAAAFASDPQSAGKIRPAGGTASLEGVLTGVLVGLVLHLVQDVIANRPRHAGVYAFLYRLRHGFDRDRVGWENHKGFHEWSGKPWYTWI
jgi:hypothetical protein